MQIRICMHKLINAQKAYNLHTAAYIAQSRTQMYAKPTTYKNTHTLRKTVHKRTENLYNIGKAAYIP